LFEEESDKNGDKIAIVSGSDEISYKELREKINGLTSMLKNEGVEEGDTVVLYQDNSVELIVGMLAALKINAAFLPVAPGTPANRLNFILTDCEAKLVYTKASLKKDLQEAGSQVKSIDVSYDDIESDKSMETGTGKSDDLAYIIYTSGTTGTPKGVMITNYGLTNYINTAIENYIPGSSGTFPLFTSPAFDLTLTSVFTPLLSGNKIIIYAGDQKEFLLDKVIEDDKCDVIKLTPSHLKLLREKAKDPSVNFKSSVKKFIVGGEQLTNDLARDISAIFNNKIEIYNEYGPTEATIGCMLYKYEKPDNNRSAVPIGASISGNQIYLLDEDLRPVPLGVTGEIYISGAGLAKGYVNNKALTNEKFISNPFSEGKRMYKTGDLGRWLADGQLEYLGRNDKQVKVRGYRIELEEIERALLQFGSIEGEEEKFDIMDSTKKLGELKRCKTCLLPENYPEIEYDDRGICNICNEFAEYKQQIDSYFKVEKDFIPVVEDMKSKNEDYDCLLLYSGGKDSTYVLYKLIDYGLKVLTYTFDNGYISETAFQNIQATTEKLGVKNIKVTSKNMHKVFSESLRTNCSACHGCWHAINTFGIQIAKRNNIRHIVSGLSRGQIYDMRLEGIFETRVFEENRIEEQLAVFRKSFHSGNNKYSKLLKVSLNNDMMSGLHFVDFFRYYNTPVRDIKAYLLSKGWIQPKDTGFCSSNCLINDVGVYTHIKEKGYNFYTAPISWDVRLGQTSREEGIEEITSFGSTEEHVHTVLKEIKYSRALVIREAIVVKSEEEGKESLTAYIVTDLPPNISDLRIYLKEKLPEYMIPSQFIQIDKIPLNASGKLELKNLPKASKDRPTMNSDYVVPGTAIEQKIAEICKEVLKMEIIGTTDNLFDLGATSFDLTGITSRLNLAFDKKINVTSLFTYTNIRELASYFGEATSPGKEEEKKTRKVSSKLGQRRTLLNKN
ncbi:MAG: amino acid adenylation domain-containing protein, partial [Cyclobacteriaceae bacterium]